MTVALFCETTSYLLEKSSNSNEMSLLSHLLTGTNENLKNPLRVSTS